MIQLAQYFFHSGLVMGEYPLLLGDEAIDTKLADEIACSMGY